MSREIVRANQQIQISNSLITDWRIKKATLLAFTCLLLYRVILDLTYYFVMSSYGDYVGWRLDINDAKVVESYFLFLIIFVLMPKMLTRLSTIMIWLLILISYIPMLTLFAFMDEPREYMYTVSGFWVLVFLLMRSPEIFIPPLKQTQSKIILYIGFFVVIAAVIFLITTYLGLSLNFDLLKVYDIRASYMSQEIPLAGYLFNWLGYVINPLFFAICLKERRWIPVAAVCMLQFVLFSVTGIKALLYAFPFIIALIWVITRRNPLAFIAAGFSGLILLGVGCQYFFDNQWLTELVIRRVLLIPARISFLYYDFFSNNELTFLSQHHIFNLFSVYPYDLPPGNMIGEAYFNRPQTNATTGIVADAYMNFGFWGFLIWGIIVAIILKLVDSFSRGKKLQVAIAAVLMPTITLVESPLLTDLLTHGLLIALLGLYLLPKPQKLSAGTV